MQTTRNRILATEVRVRRENKLLISEVSLTVDRLPQRLSGYRIMQLTDLHWGLFTAKKFLQGALSIAAKQQADLLFLTGDYVQLLSRKFGPLSTPPGKQALRHHQEKVRREVKELSQALEQIRPPDGVFAVWGNHDHLEGRSTLSRHLGSHIRWLDNSHTSLHFGDFAIQLFGVDDLNRGDPCLDTMLRTSSLTAFHSRKMLPTTDAAAPLSILLSHNPDVGLFAKTGQLSNIDLILSGHTHGGQIRLPKMPLYTSTRQKLHIAGLSQENGTHYYVNSGLGQSLLPFRLFCPPEIAIFTLLTPTPTKN